jgi:hypothetical protein
MAQLDDGTSTIIVTYDSLRLTGRLSLIGGSANSIWDRLRARVFEDSGARQIGETQIEFPWPSILGIIRDFGSRAQQQAYGFRFRFEGGAEQLARQFADEFKRSRASQVEVQSGITSGELTTKLREFGFTRRELRPFQERDLLHLVSLKHGANFSVPGAGKTTVTLALHLLTRAPGSHFFVVAPKTAFPAWMSVVEECIDPFEPGAMNEQFTLLNGSAQENDAALNSGASRFLISYDLMVRQQQMLSAYFSRRRVHIVLDEAHRMKAGFDSQRGSFLLGVSPLLYRRDILTGTPMPQGPQDIAAQLGFLWPGQGFDLQLQRGERPRAVLGQLYVRTTKTELDLPKVFRHFRDVAMLPGQLALYGVVRNETLRKLATAISPSGGGGDFLRARRSVMRLLQLSANPILALRSITSDFPGVRSGVVQAVLDEGPSSKMRAVVDHTRELAAQQKKIVIWTIFTDTILELEALLAELNPVTLYGDIPSGSSDDMSTREGRLRRFHEDSACQVMIANPAAAGEGISLHTVCHDAIYLDRSYVSTHYLQSIDRIHRLGLPPDAETNIYIYRTKAPAGLGSVDYSVSRRLSKKIRDLQELLNDTDLHEIAFDEENADDPIDYSVDLQDLVDLVEELQGRHFAPTEEAED